MSMRPPIAYVIRVTAVGMSSDAASFNLASGDTTVPEQLGPSLFLCGILFEKSADGLNFEAKPRTPPPGVALANITEVISAPSFYEKLVSSINGAGTTAFPFQLCYGPLNPWGS